MSNEFLEGLSTEQLENVSQINSFKSEEEKKLYVDYDTIYQTVNLSVELLKKFFEKQVDVKLSSYQQDGFFNDYFNQTQQQYSKQKLQQF